MAVVNSAQPRGTDDYGFGTRCSRRGHDRVYICSAWFLKYDIRLELGINNMNKKLTPVCAMNL